MNKNKTNSKNIFFEKFISSPEELKTYDFPITKISMPSSSENEVIMQENGFFFVDRTLRVSISLKKLKLELNEIVRCNIEKATSSDYDDILRIASGSFKYDRRFNLKPHYSSEIAYSFLKAKVNSLDSFYIAKLKNITIGFISFAKKNDKLVSIELCAVDERYRLSGAALSLYGFACKKALEEGFSILEGIISSQNVAVMNIYSYFGANFSSPVDIFVKERFL